MRARHYRSPSRSKVRQRPELHPRLPVVRINNNPLRWSSVSYLSRDSVDSLSSTLRRQRNMVNLIEGPKLVNRQLLSAMQKPAAEIAARKLGATVAVACDYIMIDCRCVSCEASCRVLRPKSYRTAPRCASSMRSDH